MPLVFGPLQGETPSFPGKRPVSRLSIIIPYGGNSKRLEDTLVSVLENRPPECEVLVLLSQPYENPYHLDDEVCFRRVADGAGLVEATNQGIQLSRAPIVHLLACGTEVREGWADSAVEHFQDPRVAAVAPLAIDLNHRDRVLAAGIRYTSAGRIHLCRRGCDVATLAAEADQVLALTPQRPSIARRSWSRWEDFRPKPETAWPSSI